MCIFKFLNIFLNNSMTTFNVCAIQRESTHKEVTVAREFLTRLKSSETDIRVSDFPFVFTVRQYQEFLNICKNKCLTIYQVEGQITNGSPFEEDNNEESSCTIS